MSSEHNRDPVADADVLARLQELEDRALLSEMERRHEREAEADRRERERMVEQLKQDLARDRLEEQAQTAAERLATDAEIENARPEQPRDELGRFTPAVQAVQQQPVVTDRGIPDGITDSELQAAQDGSLSMESYLQMRDRLHLGQRDAGLFG